MKSLLTSAKQCWWDCACISMHPSTTWCMQVQWQPLHHMRFPEWRVQYHRQAGNAHNLLLAGWHCIKQATCRRMNAVHKNFNGLMAADWMAHGGASNAEYALHAMLLCQSLRSRNKRNKTAASAYTTIMRCGVMLLRQRGCCRQQLRWAYCRCYDKVAT